jgi:hypothetical protein
VRGVRRVASRERGQEGARRAIARGRAGAGIEGRRPNVRSKDLGFCWAHLVVPRVCPRQASTAVRVAARQ